jgi:hypothetical protein
MYCFRSERTLSTAVAAQRVSTRARTSVTFVRLGAGPQTPHVLLRSGLVFRQRRGANSLVS